MSFLCFLLLCILRLLTAFIFDKDLSINLDGITNEDVIILTFTKVDLPKRGLNTTHQLLLSIGSPSNTHMSFILNRKQGKVLLETVIDTKSFREEVDAHGLTKKRIGSILIELQQNTKLATVYLNCKLLRTLKLEITIKELFKQYGQLNVYRSNNADVGIEGKTNILDLLEKFGCQSSKLEAGYQSQSNDIYTYQRGDIPASHADQTTSLLVNTMNDLGDTIRQLQMEIQNQREETALLRNTLANCEACKPGREEYFRG